ncbi:hypothetical protein P879_03522 [Paragonimus westermani]|uniref:Cilia- and flagella-associated protein 69 ARM repeats domain-containing protein n=1 Tax=Paragonimus westermani TaxID=34504 RepID=A0A8T0DX95_9TREM|nr:hypothetical protein P879_03522 [Paragonimus westermani]
MEREGYLLRIDNEEIQLCISDTLIELYDPIQKLPVLPEDSGLRYTSLEFVRKVIESSDIAESVFMDCLLQLRDAFFLQLAQSHSKYCRNLRNDIMTVISLIIKNAARFSDSMHIPLTELGIVKQIIQLFTLENVKHVNPLFKNLRLLPNPENFDLKKMISSALVWLVHNPTAVKVMKETRLVQTLLEWVCPFIPPQDQTLLQSGPEAPSETAADDDILGDTSEITATKLPTVTYNETEANQINVSQTDLAEESGIDRVLEEEQVEEEEEEVESENVFPNEPILVEGSQTNHLAANTRLELMKQWPLAFLEELQLHVLDTLCTLGPALLDDILLYNGPERLVQLLLWCQNSDPFVGFGNSFQSTGGYKTTRAQMRYCLRLIRNLIESSDERLIESLASHGIVQLLVSLLPMVSVCEHTERPHEELKSFGPQRVHKRGRKHDNNAISKTISNEKRLEEDVVGLEMQTDMLFILAKICEKDVQKKEILGVEGIDVLVALLSTIPDRLAQLENESFPSLQIRHPVDDPSVCASRRMDVQMLVQRTPLLTLTTTLIDAIWCGIVGSVNCEDYFLMRRGATLLLDLLEWYPRHVCSQLLGCIVDLTENPNCLPSLISWTGCRPLKSNSNIYTPEPPVRSGLEAIAHLLADAPSAAASTKLAKLVHLANNSSTVNSVPIEPTVKSTDKQTRPVISTMTDPLLPSHVTALASGPTLPEFLCYLWRWEEVERLGLPDGPQALLWKDNKVTDSDGELPHPLLPKHRQRGEKGKDLSIHQGSVDKLNSSERYDSLRLNIYALFIRIGLKNHDGLSVEDQVTMQKIEGYFDLKNSAVWSEIEAELDREKIRPVTPDAEMLLHIQRWGEKRATELCEAQKDIIQTSETNALAEEQSQYAWIREIQRYREKENTNFAEYVARTSNISRLKAARRAQLDAIEASRIGRSKEQVTVVGQRPVTPTPPSSDVNIDDDKARELRVHESPWKLGTASNEQQSHSVHHKTDIPGLNVTAFTSQTIQIESTPRQLFYQPTPLEKEMLKVIL